MNTCLHIGVFAHGPSLLAVYITVMTVTPLIGALCALKDFRELSRDAHLETPWIRFRGYLTVLRNDTIILLWCLLMGCGMVIFGSFAFFGANTILQRILILMLVVIPGALLGYYGERKTIGRL